MAILEPQLRKATEKTQMDLLKVRTQNSAFIDEVIAQLDPFTTVIGDLDHFLNGGDQIVGLIQSWQENGTLLESDVCYWICFWWVASQGGSESNTRSHFACLGHAEGSSSEKAGFTYISSTFLRTPNPSIICNTSLTGINTFDDLYPPEYAGMTIVQNRHSCCDKCLNSSQNSVDLLKSFKKQWYKSKDIYRNTNTAFRTNIGQKPPKIPRINNPSEITPIISSSPSQEVRQVGNVAPADPSMLEKILKDPMGFINVQGKLREVRFYGEKAIVMMDWNDPRDVCFQSSSRRVIIDDKDILILSFNTSYSNYTFSDGTTIKIRLGAPTRDFYIDGEPVEVKFGGPPVEILVGDSHHKIQLGGPNPQVYIGNVKRSDIMAGRINLIIDEDLNNIFHIYLDPKPQKFNINGTPFILRFVDSLQIVLINERPFKTDFGGAPIAVKLFGIIHLLRFSSLPPEVKPGLVHIVNMESYDTNPGIRNLFPSVLPSNDPNLTSLTAIANNSHYYINYGGEPKNENLSIGQNNNSNLTCNLKGQSDVQQSIHFDADGINVINLYQKLVEKGIIQPPAGEKLTKNDRSKIIKVDFSKPESLKLRNMRIAYELYTGAQCSICSLRFMRKSGEYESHMDWHYQMKMHTSNELPKWWCHPSEFPRSEQDVGQISWFEKQKRLDPFSIYEKLTVPAKDYGPMPTCSFCLEEFNQFYDEVTEEWMLNNAVVHNLNLCHPGCCFKVNEQKLTSLEVEVDTKKIFHQENDGKKIFKDSCQSNVGVESETGPIVEQYETVIPYSIVDDKTTTDAKLNELSINKGSNEPCSDDLEENDMEDVIVITPEIEIVDLSEEDIKRFEKSPIVKMSFSSSFLKCNENELNAKNEHQKCLNKDYSNEISEASLNADSGSSEKEIEFNETSVLTPSSVKPMIRDAKMTARLEVVEGEIDSSLCSIT